MLKYEYQKHVLLWLSDLTSTLILQDVQSGTPIEENTWLLLTLSLLTVEY